MQCGREPGGKNAVLGVCPAARDRESSGINGGVNAGRYCWRIAGTYCENGIQGVFAQKAGNCGDCAVFREIMLQEGPGFQL